MQVPSAFYVRFQHGIQGGIAPPTPNEVHMLSRDGDTPNTLLIQSQVRAPGQPSLTGFAPKKVDFAAQAMEPKFAKLYAILRDLPTEEPPGSQDIYDMDTQIQWMDDKWQWCNGGPEGCGMGESFVIPTPEQKARFKEAVEIVKALV
ncbi:hypothetical protein FRB97_002074 [Tulasnella sp. 331]|nr:hypothetical protein FRB97_002074 [Tulasnella sp. 331]KAG8869172.1 hypothetical protein FRB98_002788 [Tulasnella sp. 332]